eukprot:comp15425_c0_seq1/m.23451 comp15425_c0_seq1/g.23451  ORF comp15425_c0_seq1/g.23451 comp15425_c0_seq1/m.23451 type:complete len:465 (-) comp15425_c0_seq1:9-1403(-)
MIRVAGGLSRLFSTRFPQVHISTHPELFRLHELTPGLPRSEFHARRCKLAAAMPEGSLLVLRNESTQYSAHDIPFLYRGDSDVFYLSGIQEPDALIAIYRPQNPMEATPGEAHEFLAAVTPRSKTTDLWEGATIGVDRLVETFGADVAMGLNDISELRKRLRSAKTVLLDPRTANKGVLPREVIEDAKASKAQLETARPLIDRLRVLKSPAELALLTKAAELTTAGFKRTMRDSRDPANHHERILAATFEYEVRRRGAPRLTFPCVVASGANALVIHYLFNDSKIPANAMVLQDSGAEYHYYSSDVTRTWPVSGKFTDTQRTLYLGVHEIHKNMLEMCKKKGTSLLGMHTAALEQVGYLCRSLGLPSSLDVVQSTFFAHSACHHMGIDCHDAQHFPFDHPLESGHVIAIEPGLYIPDDPKFPKDLRGIGIRIEDNVVIGDEQKITVLSDGIPRLPDAIEEWMNS